MRKLVLILAVLAPVAAAADGIFYNYCMEGGDLLPPTADLVPHSDLCLCLQDIANGFMTQADQHLFFVEVRNNPNQVSSARLEAAFPGYMAFVNTAEVCAPRQ